jgi:hypothetical protein
LFLQLILDSKFILGMDRVGGGGNNSIFMNSGSQSNMNPIGTYGYRSEFAPGTSLIRPRSIISVINNLLVKVKYNISCP